MATERQDGGGGADTLVRPGDAVDPVRPEALELLRAPQQERSRRTLARMVQSAHEILEAEGADGLTVTAITRRARTSVGSFYARFDGKEDLLRYLGEASLQEAVRVWRASGRDGRGGGEGERELRDEAARAVARLLDLYMDGPARALLLLDGVEDPSPRRRPRLEDALARDLAGGLPAPRGRAELGARCLLAVVREAAFRTGAGEGVPFPSREVLEAELVELLVGYLGGEVRGAAPETPPTEAPEGDAAVEEGPRRPSGSDIDPFDVWE